MGRGTANPPLVIAAAGLDPCGAAGLAADLKTIAALGAHGAAALTAVTVQNSRELLAVEPVAPELVRRQVDAVLADRPAAAMKTGMLVNAGIIECLARAVTDHGIGHLVVDPVMLASSGGELMDPDAVDILVHRLFPLADLVTPNIPEAEVILGRPLRRAGDLEPAARELHRLGARAVLLKGGHGRETDTCRDLLFDGEEALPLSASRIITRNDRGTGCTLASAVAALLARGRDLREAVGGARAYVRAALLAAAGRQTPGRAGPLEHFPDYPTDPTP